MKILLASSERFAGCVIHCLTRLGHEVSGVVSPAKGIYHRQYRGPRFWYYDLRGWDILDSCRSRNIEFRVSRQLDEGAITAFIKNKKPDLLLLFGWPTMVTPQTLALFPYGGMNIHPSLLPKLRGPDPLFTIVDQGHAGFGISFHKVVAELDAGPIHYQIPLQCKSKDTYDDLYFKLLRGIVANLATALDNLVDKPAGNPQVGEPSSIKSFEKKDRILDPTWPLEDLARRVRACYSHHPCITAFGGKLITFSNIKVLKAQPIHKQARAVQSRGPFSVVVNLQGRCVRLSGARIPDKPWWWVAPWLYTLCRPGSLLATAAEVHQIQAALRRKRKSLKH